MVGGIICQPAERNASRSRSWITGIWNGQLDILPSSSLYLSRGLDSNPLHTQLDLTLLRRCLVLLRASVFHSVPQSRGRPLANHVCEPDL